MPITGALETTKLINARPDGVRTTDQDHTDTWLYFTSGRVKFANKTQKNEFSLVFVMQVASIAGAVIGSTITGGTSGATGVIAGISGSFLYLSTTTGTFQNAETITAGAYSTTITSTLGVGISGGKSVLKATRSTTSQFSPVPNKSFLAEYEGYISTDPTYQLKHAIKTIDVSGNKKVYIELPSANVEDASLNSDQNGLSIATIQSTTAYPSHTNYIPLRSITGGSRQTSTDDRDILLIDGKYLDLSNLDQDIITSGDLYCDDIITSEGNVDARIDNIESIVSGGGSVTDVVIGENVTAGDGLGSVFLGKGNTPTKLDEYLNGVTEVAIGNIDSNTRFGIIFRTPDIFNKIDSIEYFELDLKKYGTPTDNLEIRLFQNNKTTAVVGRSMQTIAGSSLSVSFSLGNTFLKINGQNTPILSNTEYFLEIKRSNANDAVNYYSIRTHNTSLSSVGYSTYTGSTNTWSATNTNDIYMRIQYAKNFTQGQAFLTDSRYTETNKSDGIVTVSGTTGQTRQLRFGGFVGGSYPSGDYYINSDLGPISISQTQQLQINNEDRLYDSGGNIKINYFSSFTILSAFLLKTTTIRTKSSNFGPKIVSLSIVNDNAGTPGNTVIASSLSTPIVNTISFEDCDFYFNDVFISPGTYWIKVEFVGSGSGYITIGFNSTNVSPQLYGIQNILPTPGSFTLQNKDLYYVFNKATSTSVDNITRIFTGINRQFGRFVTSQITNLLPFLIGKGIGSKIKIFENENNYQLTDYNEYISYVQSDLGFNRNFGANTVNSKTIKLDKTYYGNFECNLFNNNLGLPGTFILFEYSVDNITYETIYNQGSIISNTTINKTIGLYLKKGFIRLSITTGPGSSSASVNVLGPLFALNKL